MPIISNCTHFHQEAKKAKRPMTRYIYESEIAEKKDETCSDSARGNHKSVSVGVGAAVGFGVGAAVGCGPGHSSEWEKQLVSDWL
jgi:hypothetical protein